MNIEDFIKKNQLVLHVKPNAKKTEITGFDKEKQCLKISIKAPPEDNKANIEVVKFMAKQLKRKVTISKGLKSKRKILRVE